MPEEEKAKRDAEKAIRKQQEKEKKEEKPKSGRLGKTSRKHSRNDGAPQRGLRCDRAL